MFFFLWNPLMLAIIYFLFIHIVIISCHFLIGEHDNQ
jgi:hypothetical protein